jgi:hypothetical protein
MAATDQREERRSGGPANASRSVVHAGKSAKSRHQHSNNQRLGARAKRRAKRVVARQAQPK